MLVTLGHNPEWLLIKVNNNKAKKIMSSLGKLLLSWDGHKEHILETLQSMYDKEEYSDCTLICRDGYSIDVHKAIVSACSPVLNKLVRQFPLEVTATITLADVSKHELAALVQYMYTGETSVPISELENFFGTCKCLEIVHLNEYSVEKETALEPTIEDVSNSSELVHDFPIRDYYSQCEIDASEHYLPVETSADTITDGLVESLLSEVKESNLRLRPSLEPKTMSRRKKLKEGQVTNYSQSPSSTNSNRREMKLRMNRLDLKTAMNKKEDRAVDFDLKKQIIDHGTSGRRYECRRCSSRYSHKRTILHHIHWICGQPPTYECSLCKYKGKRKFQLRSHMEHVHMLFRIPKKRKSLLRRSVPGTSNNT